MSICLQQIPPIPYTPLSVRFHGQQLPLLLQPLPNTYTSTHTHTDNTCLVHLNLLLLPRLLKVGNQTPFLPSPPSLGSTRIYTRYPLHTAIKQNHHHPRSNTRYSKGAHTKPPSMAANLPTFNFNPLAPVTPPPEHLTFRKPALPLSAQLKRKAAEANITDDHVTTTKMKKEESSQNTPFMASMAAPPKPTSIPNASAADPNQPTMDPRYMAMVSRIAAYYQQRCQAISNAQQQKCQAWANMYRQKCQEMMQAAMLVVAWYIRDRIQRRRRRQKRQFRTGLRAQSTRSRIAKGEGVRRWVMNVPEGLSSPQVPGVDGFADQEEAHFSMDREVPPDKDAKLFEMADGMIRSQYRKIEVPILGVLGFDEDESESESEADDDFDQPMEDEFEDGAVEEYDEDEDEDDLDLDDEYEDEEQEAGSEVAHRGTGTGTGTGSRGKDSGLSS